jgi:hypothetical protein
LDQNLNQNFDEIEFETVNAIMIFQSQMEVFNELLEVIGS